MIKPSSLYEPLVANIHSAGSNGAAAAVVWSARAAAAAGVIPWAEADALWQIHLSIDEYHPECRHQDSEQLELFA